uniref:MINDY family member 4B n=1 Tax=Labrus bergylta TaxID=56723 RepID=A0A3Q3FKD6_9LABR
QSLRRILFGRTFHVFNYEWRKSVFKFREPGSELSYTLETDQLCEVGQKDQEGALVAALSDSLWLAGQEISATVTLVTKDYCITPHLDYKLDDFTERLQLFTFHQKEDVRRFILEHVQCQFTEEGSHGVILFLYSLICSRAADVGSMLKTPRFPVWLVSVNSSCSVVFSLKRSLLSDWRMEHLFNLYYYNGTHSHHWEAASTDQDSERRSPSLEMTIRTKWGGAAIDWNGTLPFY